MSVEICPLNVADLVAAHGGGGAGGRLSVGSACGTGRATTAGSSASCGGGSAGSPGSIAATAVDGTVVVDVGEVGEVDDGALLRVGSSVVDAPTVLVVVDA